MFVERVALDAVPGDARIGQAAVDAVISRLLCAEGGQERALRAAFVEMEQRQPRFAAYVAHELAELDVPEVQAAAYFLSVLVYRVFEEAFGARLARVELPDINRALARLVADSELRAAHVRGQTYSEDAIAVGQPALLCCVRAQIERAMQRQPDLAWERLDAFYESLLVMILVLTQAVVVTTPLERAHSS
jgi:hypothetical protein